MGNGHGPGRKKNGESDKDVVERVLREFVKPKVKSKIITREDLERAERERVNDMAHFEVFLNWVAMGGMMRGLSLTEAATLPVTLLQDMVYFSNKYHDAQDAQEAAEEAKREMEMKIK